jgi:hypothetical protein
MSARAFTILDAIGDKRLFGAAIKDVSTWRAWFVFLAALFGIRRRRIGQRQPDRLPFAIPKNLSRVVGGIVKLGVENVVVGVVQASLRYRSHGRPPSRVK